MLYILVRCTLCLLLTVTGISAADLTGIWTGQVPGRNNEIDDVAFQFKVSGNTVTGTLFGDEFDLPIEEGSFTGDQLKFKVTTTNYYSGNKTKFLYTGIVKGNEIELTREREGGPPQTGGGSRNPQNLKRTFTLKRLI